MFTLKFGTTLLYSIPSMVLYSMTIVMVRRFPKDFSSTFLNLYITFFVCNNITFFNSFITVRIPQNTCNDCLMSFLFKAHSATNPSWFPLNFFYFIHYNMAYMQFLMIFLTSLNRFTMIFWSTRYEKVWKRMFFPAVLAIVLCPIPFTLQVLTSSTYYVYTESLDCFTVASTMDRELVYNQLLAALTLITVITAIVNIASFYRLSCMAFKISVAERNLLFVSGSLFIVQLVADINTTINRLVLNDSNKDSLWSKVAVTLLPYVSDGLTLIHPWMFLAFSTKARRCFVILYVPGYKDAVATTNNSIHFISREMTGRRTQVGEVNKF
ncbi:unnamed protein product [Caenorhabditis sp. 36 PRJEB53466]|nr:unnamed protein product [Caenorhabditis sp. 36 PRJEB53466]